MDNQNSNEFFYDKFDFKNSAIIQPSQKIGKPATKMKYVLIDKFQYIYDKETMLKKFHKTQLSKKIDKDYFDHLFTNYYTDPFMNSLTSTYNNQFLLRSIKSYIKENNSQEKKVQKSRKKKQ